MGELYEVCFALEKEMKCYGPLGGIMLEVNSFNLFNLFRNYKNKQAAVAANLNPAALLAQQLLKFHSERLVVSTDRFFTTSVCSQVAVPPPLACVIFKLQQNVRKRTLTAWKTLAGGRKGLMALTAEFVARFGSLDARGLLTPRFKAFVKLTFPPCRVQSIVNLLKVVHAQRITNIKSLNFPRMKKRTTHSSIVSSDSNPSIFSLPEPLLSEFNGEGMLKTDVFDVNPFLQSPEEFLAMDFYDYIKKFYGMGVFGGDCLHGSVPPPPDENVLCGPQVATCPQEEPVPTTSQPLTYVPTYLYAQVIPGAPVIPSAQVISNTQVVPGQLVTSNVQVHSESSPVAGIESTSSLPLGSVSLLPAFQTVFQSPKKATSKRKRQEVDDSLPVHTPEPQTFQTIGDPMGQFPTINTTELLKYTSPNTIFSYQETFLSENLAGPNTNNVLETSSQGTQENKPIYTAEEEDEMLNDVLKSLYGEDTRDPFFEIQQMNKTENVMHLSTSDTNPKTEADDGNEQLTNESEVNIFELHHQHLEKTLLD
nr:protein Rta [Macronycteris gammaherpesvirus 1]